MNAERLERMPLKQYIILRKDAPTVTGAPVSPQKLAVMTAHASMCFLSHLVLEHCNANGHVVMDLDAETFGWMRGPFTKILLSAKNLHALENAVRWSEERGFVEGKDFFCIRDDCATELLPDEGRKDCFIAIGYRPMDEMRLRPIMKKFELYR